MSGTAAPSRTRSRTLTAALLSLGLLVGCDVLDVDGDVRLRVENNGAIGFDEVTLFTQDGPRTFTDLEPGEATSYFVVSRDFGYASTHVVAQADTAVIQVIDFVGEEPVDAGDYTYLIALVDEAGHLSLRQEVRRD